MGFAYCLFQPYVAHSSEAAAFGVFKQQNTSKVSNSKSVGNSKFLFNSLPAKRLKRIAASRDQSALSSRLLFNCYLCKSSSCGNIICLKTYRGVLVPRCQGNDSVSFVNGNVRDSDSIESGNDGSPVIEANPIAEISSLKGEHEEHKEEEEVEEPTLDGLRELFQKALKDLEVARINSTMFEEKAQRISEAAIVLKDEAANARKDVNDVLNSIQEIVNEESAVKEAVQKATMALSLAEARLQVAIDSLEISKESSGSQETSGESKGEAPTTSREGNELLLAVNKDINECQDCLANCIDELRQLQNRKEELLKEVERLNEVVEQAEMNALKAEEDVANIMLLAEQAVAFELEATQRVSDAEIALQKAEKSQAISKVDSTEATNGQVLVEGIALEDEVTEGNLSDVEKLGEVPPEDAWVTAEPLAINQFDVTGYKTDEAQLSDESDKEDGELDSEKSKNVQSKKQELQKESARDSSPLNAPKTLLNKSSRFFSASFFSFSADGEEFTPASVFHGLMESARKEFIKLVVGSLLFGAG